jgi:hypothetical protein
MSKLSLKIFPSKYPLRRRAFPRKGASRNARVGVHTSTVPRFLMPHLNSTRLCRLAKSTSLPISWSRKIVVCHKKKKLYMTGDPLKLGRFVCVTFGVVLNLLFDENFDGDFKNYFIF